MRHDSEIFIPGFRKPILLKLNVINKAQGTAAYVKKPYSTTPMDAGVLV